MHFGPSHPSVFAIASWDTTAWTIPERVKPRINGQRISQNILKDVNNACPILLTICIDVRFSQFLYADWNKNEVLHRRVQGCCVSYEVCLNVQPHRIYYPNCASEASHGELHSLLPD